VTGIPHPASAPKNIPNPGFANDTGEPDTGLASALEVYARERGGPDRTTAEDAVHAALPGTRLLIPVVAVLGETTRDAAGRAMEKDSSMAVPTINAPGGRRALPAFTGTAALTRWRSDARPVAVFAHDAARAALQERADTLLIDLGGPAPFPVAGARLYLLARGGEPVAPIEDPAVADAVRALLEDCAAVRAAYLEPDGGTDLTLRLVLAAGMDRAAVQRAAELLAADLAADPVLRVALARGLALALHPPGTPEPAALLYRRA
jgi:hypothetical protein